MNFGKVMTAMVTPFKNGEVNYEEAKKLAKFFEDNGSDSLLICGSTGENPTMTKEEKINLVKAVKEAVSIPIMVGTGSNNTKESIEFTKEIDALGVDGFLMVTPYYNKPNQKGIYEHFKAIAQCTDTDIMLYNIPGRSIKEIEVPTVIELSKIKNITSLKAACGNLDKITSSIKNTSDDFLVYAGDDSLTLPIMSLGGVGVVSVASSIIGNDMQAMIKKFEEGNIKEAASINLKCFDIYNAMFCDSNPVPVKYALSLLGFDTTEVRLPLVELDQKEKDLIKSVMEKHNLV